MTVCPSSPACNECSPPTRSLAFSAKAHLLALFDAAAASSCTLMVHSSSEPEAEQTFLTWLAARNLTPKTQILSSLVGGSRPLRWRSVGVELGESNLTVLVLLAPEGAS